MRRSFILHGDRTTKGGVVAVSTRTMVSNGKAVCVEGSAVYCPACKTTGKTVCVPPFLPCKGPGGRQANLHGDLCVCQCKPPPKLIASSNDMQMDCGGAAPAHQAGADGKKADQVLAAATPLSAQTTAGSALAAHTAERYDQFFRVVDRATGRPIRSEFAYGLKCGTGEHHGSVFDDGSTAKAYAQEVHDVELVYLMQTKIGTRP